uniref:hypothetical protein n=1 Tax=Vibrio parahaemolyticus TaxID=670 RepID=UPI00349E8FAF
MSKSLAAHIRFSKLSVLVAALISSSVIASNSPLTSEDMAIIEQGRELAEKARKMEELPDWAKNTNLDQAQVEARQVFPTTTRIRPHTESNGGEAGRKKCLYRALNSYFCILLIGKRRAERRT